VNEAALPLLFIVGGDGLPPARANEKKKHGRKKDAQEEVRPAHPQKPFASHDA
jgi:hypothetical protein